MLVSLNDAADVPLAKASIFLSQLSVTIKNSDTAVAYTQAMNDYKASWVGASSCAGCTLTQRQMTAAKRTMGTMVAAAAAGS